MKTHSLTLLFLLLLCVTALAQKTKRSEGEYQLNLSRSNLSEAEACQQCMEQARVQAIEKAFGTVIIQGNTTLIRNAHTGETTETKEVFNMIAETYVNGDWTKTLKEDCERFTHEGEFWLRCEVKGVVQELQAPRIDLAFKPLDCEQPSCATTTFYEEEPFYLWLKSPVSGYLSIYLSDGHTVQRLFPYRNMPEGMESGVKIKADAEYLLFSRARDGLDLRSYVDEYLMYAETEQDQNRLYVIYSEKPLRKPALDRSEADDALPMQMSSDDFHRWLAANRRYEDEMAVLREDILIRKK